MAARSFPPFVSYEDRTFDGFSVELVDLIADELGVDYELYGVNTIAKQLDDLDRDAADVAVAGIAITARRERHVDFTHTITTVGYGDKSPHGSRGKGWALLWMIAGYFVFASFTASITSSLAMEQLRGAIQGPDDLNGHRVVTVAGTEAEDFLEQQGVGPVTVARIDDAYTALVEGDADAVAFDAPVLQFHAAHDGHGEVRVVGPVFDRVQYGIALPVDSPLRERINLALLDLVESGAYDRLHDRWFGATMAVGGS
ncbi:MAG: transporter substrate-binding domain-containing protein [Actinobacteria bacterium]|nr:transporter substrate-binding domain-containing protein [Actinomycetota bacterium]